MPATIETKLKGKQIKITVDNGASVEIIDGAIRIATSAQPLSYAPFVQTPVPFTEPYKTTYTNPFVNT